jgi:hypothetical protein
MLEVKKTNEGVVLSLSFQLDKEDVKQLVDDLNVWLQFDYEDDKLNWEESNWPDELKEQEYKNVSDRILSDIEIKDAFDEMFNDTVELPKFKGISEDKLKEAKPMLQDKAIDTTGWSKDKLEAYQQAQRKLRLEKEMRRMFVDVLDDEYLETKFATVYKLDEINREIEILQKKLNKK